MAGSGQGGAGTLALGALAAGLLALAVWQVAREDAVPVAARLAPPPAPPARLAAPAAPAADYPAITERPLFARTRQRPALVAAAQAAEPPPPPAADLAAEYRLLGITLDGDRTTALLRRVAGGATLRLRTGEALGEWRLAGAERKRTVVFERDGARQELTMDTSAPRAEAPIDGGPVDEDELDDRALATRGFAPAPARR